MIQEILTMSHVTKRFYHPTLVELFSEIDFSITMPSITAIMGASGEGKTTLLHLLGGLENPDMGEIIFLAKNLKDWDIALLRSQHIGFVFQNFNLIEDLTALQNVLLPAQILRKKYNPLPKDFVRAKDLLKNVGLEERLNFPVKILSGGEKQRVAIARSFMNNPDLILADEPSGNLDHNSAKEIHKILLDCARKENKALIVATHNLELANQCDEIFLLKNGKINSLKPKTISVK